MGELSKRLFGRVKKASGGRRVISPNKNSLLNQVPIDLIPIDNFSSHSARRCVSRSITSRRISCQSAAVISLGSPELSPSRSNASSFSSVLCFWSSLMSVCRYSLVLL
jgi:hypothetical protein